MLLAFLSIVAAAVSGLEAPGWPSAFAIGRSAVTASYEPGQRAVTTWRVDASAALHPAPLAWLARIAPEEPAFVSRCVRLNNYWCIKRAGWAGEIGADAEGHTAFADADAGADAAVTLLRRYYVTYGRHTARAIVKHWAPAECGEAGRRRLGPEPRMAGAALAVHGIGRTLRARFLARHGRGGQALRRPGGTKRVAANPRIQPFSPLALRAGRPSRPPRPAGVRPIGPAPTTVLADAAPMVSLMASLPATFLPPPPLCAADTTRIANYAARIAASVGRGPDDDLGLFASDGRPQPTLAPAMLAMSAVELGTFRARAELVAAAIARATPPTLDHLTCAAPCGAVEGTPPSFR